MAVNRDSNAYTVVFAIVMVAVVGALLAFLAIKLKPIQQKNAEIKKKMDILGAMSIESDRTTAEDLYTKHVLADQCIVIDFKGNVMEGVDAFDADIKKEFRDKSLSLTDRQYPLYVGQNEGKTFYIIPMVGTGLWGPIWGYVALNEDKSTISGVVFDHQGETPGLGAEIKMPIFTSDYPGEKITDENGSYKQLVVVKDKSGDGINFKVDGITGGTITSKGVEEMVDRTLQVYVKYFKNN
jgi:Na+-transporting NADH:ubiquinone oxidoreductase subunit C